MDRIVSFLLFRETFRISHGSSAGMRAEVATTSNRAGRSLPSVRIEAGYVGSALHHDLSTSGYEQRTPHPVDFSSVFQL
jgi:hypothetical protein